MGGVFLCVSLFFHSPSFITCETLGALLLLFLSTISRGEAAGRALFSTCFAVYKKLVKKTQPSHPSHSFFLSATNSLNAAGCLATHACNASNEGRHWGAAAPPGSGGAA